MYPAKAVEQNKMPFGRDTRVVPSNILLDRSPGPPQEGEICGSEPPIRSDAAFFAKFNYFDPDSFLASFKMRHGGTMSKFLNDIW